MLCMASLCYGATGACFYEKLFKNGAIWYVFMYIFVRFCLKFFQKLIFIYKKNYSSCMLVLCYLDQGEIFENKLQLMHFNVYFEIILNTNNGYFQDTQIPAMQTTLEQPIPKKTLREDSHRSIATDDGNASGRDMTSKNTVGASPYTSSTINSSRPRSTYYDEPRLLDYSKGISNILPGLHV